MRDKQGGEGRRTEGHERQIDAHATGLIHVDGCRRQQSRRDQAGLTGTDPPAQAINRQAGQQAKAPTQEGNGQFMAPTTAVKGDGKETVKQVGITGVDVSGIERDMAESGIFCRQGQMGDARIPIGHGREGTQQTE